MRTYTPPLGVGVDQVLKAMVNTANAVNEPVTARFNGDTLIAKPGDDFVVLAAQRWKDAEAQHEAWKKRQGSER